VEINYLQHSQIDKQKWDSTITNSPNGLVYALSWFLDIVSPNWDALILGDYEMLMPLPHKKKYGISYLFQPVFVQQLGVFSKDDITIGHVQHFINSLFTNFKFVDIQLNSSNPGLNQSGFKIRETQLIDISKPYVELYSNYSKSQKLNLHKFNESGIKLVIRENSSDFLDLMQEMFYSKRIKGIRRDNFQYLKKVIDFSLDQESGQIYITYLENEICAAAYFLKWKNRVILYSAMNNKGRKISAMFGIIDKYFQENAGKDLTFDFAGSNIPGVKYRNMGFGATNEVYYKVKVNNLPIPYKWFKR